MANGEKIEKYYEAPELETEVKKILDLYPEKFDFAIADVKCIWKTGKIKLGTNQVSVRFIKEPITLVTPYQAMIVAVDGWWKDSIHSDRTKGVLSAMLSIINDHGVLVKRDYDVKTYSELLGDKVIDYSRFERVLPAEAKLTLTAN